MMRSVCNTVLLPLAIILVMGVTPSIAKDMSPQEMEILREKVRADKKLVISQNMGLTQSEAGRFWPVYDRYQKELERLAKRSGALIEDYSKHYNTMSDVTAKNLMDRYLAIQSDRLKVRRAYLPEFRQALPGKKVARYYQLENKIRAVVRFQVAANIPIVQ